MDKESKKNTGLVAVLIGLVVLVIALIVGVVIFITSGFLSAGAGCEKLDNEDERNVCLANVMSDGDEKKIEDSYNAVLNKALNDEDYYTFADVLIDKLNSLATSGQCEEALKSVDDDRLGRLPDNELSYYYSLAVGVAIDCNDEEKRQEIEDKHSELVDSGKVTIPVFEEDEEIIEEENIDESEEEV